MSLASLKRKDLFQQHGLIGDKWVSSSGGGTFTVTNPATLETLATLPEMNGADTESAITAAHTAFQSFRKTTARQRATWLRKWHALCLENIDDLALILTLENGKTLAEAKGERVHGEVVPASNANQRILTVKQPLGVAACLAPWNFPIAMITRKVGAALAAGCTTVWKPAGETPLSALAQAALAREAGFPSGTINVITTLNSVAEVGTALCNSKLVRKLSFTGSTRIGKLLASQCSQNLTKLSLELGGNSPFIVFDDAKVETAVEAYLCQANRIFVQENIYDRFSAALVEKVKALKVGNGVEEGVFIGPLTHERAVEKAVAHIKDAQEKGASLLLGGSPCQPNNLQGYFLEPTVLGKMSTEALTTREEVFAPVVALYPFKTEEEVLAKANDCDVGLGSYVITESMPRMWRVAENLEVGMVGINMGTLSAAESPFGGVKESGYGREGGRQGIEEYMTVKSILMNVAA
ncbi:Aldehyde/histidinol dehydrogenase [Aspergillus tetrazonus]